MRYSGPAFIQLVLLAACAESGSIPTSTEGLRPLSNTSNYVAPGVQEAPAELGPEFQVPTSLSVEADAGWRYGYAFAGTIVRYTATNVYAKATVTTESGSNSHDGGDHQFFPVSNDFQVEDATVAMKQCVGTIRGTSFGKVWNETLLSTSLVRWGEQSASSTKHYQCPRSTTTTTTTPSGGASTEVTCYTLEIDYYWYYPDTGRVEYRYTETYSWCEKGGDAAM